MGKNTGTTFEDHVAICCDVYRAQGRADITKVTPPSRCLFIGPGRQKTILLENPYLDFVGTWTERGGRAIHLEAKTTQAARLPVGNDAGVNAEQLANLDRWHRAGAAVGVLWEHGSEVRFVSLTALQHAREVEERVSVRWEKAYQIPPGEGFLSFDFLAVLSKLYACAAS